jgi:hypothetical protein
LLWGECPLRVVCRSWVHSGDGLLAEMRRVHIPGCVLCGRAGGVVSLELVVKRPDRAWSIQAKELDLLRQRPYSVLEVSYQSLSKIIEG